MKISKGFKGVFTYFSKDLTLDYTHVCQFSTESAIFPDNKTFYFHLQEAPVQRSMGEATQVSQAQTIPVSAGQLLQTSSIQLQGSEGRQLEEILLCLDPPQDQVNQQAQIAGVSHFLFRECILQGSPRMSYNVFIKGTQHAAQFSHGSKFSKMS